MPNKTKLAQAGDKVIAWIGPETSMPGTIQSIDWEAIGEPEVYVLLENGTVVPCSPYWLEHLDDEDEDD